MICGSATFGCQIHDGLFINEEFTKHVMSNSTDKPSVIKEVTDKGQFRSFYLLLFFL